MDFLNSWLQGIIVAVIIVTIIEMILPNGTSKKYIKVVLGVYVVFSVISPIISKFFNSNFEISSLINIENYNKKLQSYEENSTSIDKTNEKNIKEIYENSLKNDMKSKIKEKGYLVKNIQIKLEDNKDYSIKNIELQIVKNNNKNEEYDKNSNITVINEIKKVDIKISNNIEEINSKEKNKEEESKITSKEKREIINYLISVYELKENQILIN